MDFTPLIPCGKIPSVATDSYIATVFLPSRIIVRSSTSLSIKRVINVEADFAANVLCLSWSISQIDGHHRLLVTDTKTAEIHDMDDEQRLIRISEGLGGIRCAEWSVSGAEILIWSEFQLKLTVWSILANSGTILPNPKFGSKGLHIRPRGHKQAVLLQRTSHDILSILDTSGELWRIQKSFVIDTTDAQGVLWSSDGKWLAVWDHIIDYRVLIYTPDGRLAKDYKAYEIGFGIKTITWAPTGEHLAIGSYDNKVRLLNTTTFSPNIELSHVSTIRNSTTTIWRQVHTGKISRYDLAHQPISPPYNRCSPGEADPKQGISHLSFSPDGSFLASKCENMPTTLWIWSLRQLAPVAILVHSNPIKTITWIPSEIGELVFNCQGTDGSCNEAIYLWNIDWACPRIITIPREGFEVKWIKVIEASSQGDAGIAIGSNDSFTIGYPVPEDSDSDGVIPEEDEEESGQDDIEGASTMLSESSSQNSVIIHRQVIDSIKTTPGRLLSVQ